MKTRICLTNGLMNGSPKQDETQHFHAVIIGGGQSGLSTGGRLQALGVPYVIIEMKGFQSQSSSYVGLSLCTIGTVNLGEVMNASRINIDMYNTSHDHLIGTYEVRCSY